MNEGFLLTGEELDSSAIWGGTISSRTLLMRSRKHPLWNNKVIFTLCRKKIRVLSPQEVVHRVRVLVPDHPDGGAEPRGPF